MLNEKGHNRLVHTLGGESLLFIVSAPSGAGKTTLCKMAENMFSGMRHSVSYTTRPPRDGEANGADYNFVSPDKFDNMLKKGEFLEWAEVYGYRYGTSVKDLNSLVANGNDVILDIDVQGAKKVKESAIGKERGVFIFILPPSIEVCEERLKDRGKDDGETIRKRVEGAKQEIKESAWYDYIIINENIGAAFEKFKSVIIAEKTRRERVKDKVKKLFGI
ncbi:MAG TPA: guanylate kinase [Deltaproteobacteria bacterium]|nr:guanylate kinase [Deltaproteobacteria bacterium]